MMLKKKEKISILSIIVLIALLIAYFSLNYTKEGNGIIATEFAKNEATYEFDGIDETFTLVRTIELDCQYCFEFHFQYQSSNSGFGDRKGLVLNSVITNHNAVINMQKGNINSAILDGTWDMQKQIPVPSESPPEWRR